MLPNKKIAGVERKTIFEESKRCVTFTIPVGNFTHPAPLIF